MTDASLPAHTHIAIVGSGFSGLGAAVKLNEAGGCASWYLDAHGNNTTLWPDFTFRFRRQTRRFDVAAYETSSLQSASALWMETRRAA